MKSIPYGRQFIDDADIQAVTDVLKSDWLTQGPAIDEFEKNFAKYIGCKYAVAVSNGTAALHLASLSLGVKERSKVITTPLTFAASANGVLYCGGEIDFVDINPLTGLMDIDKFREKVSSQPKGYYSGVIPVDFAGYPVNSEKIRQIADEYGMWILEDACHAPGGYFIDSTNEKRFCGSGFYADLTVFSFHPVKHIATGEGGMITTNDKTHYERLLRLRTHGITKNPDLLKENHGGWYYEMQELGYNYRIPDLLAALGNSQLKKAESNLKRRRELAKIYDDSFSTNSFIKILNKEGNKGHAYHLYVILVDDRKGLYDHLKENNVHAQIHYIPVHLQPYYKSLGWKKEDFPYAEKYYERCLSLPMYPSLSDEEQRYVIDLVLSYCNK